MTKGISKSDLDEVILLKTNMKTRSNGYKFEKIKFRKEGKNWFMAGCLMSGTS